MSTRTNPFFVFPELLDKRQAKKPYNVVLHKQAAVHKPRRLLQLTRGDTSGIGEYGHEIGHLLYSPDNKPKDKSPAWMEMLAVVEDTRVNLANAANGMRWEGLLADMLRIPAEQYAVMPPLAKALQLAAVAGTDVDDDPMALVKHMDLSVDSPLALYHYVRDTLEAARGNSMCAPWSTTVALCDELEKKLFSDEPKPEEPDNANSNADDNADNNNNNADDDDNAGATSGNAGADDNAEPDDSTKEPSKTSGIESGDNANDNAEPGADDDLDDDLNDNLDNPDDLDTLDNLKQSFNATSRPSVAQLQHNPYKEFISNASADLSMSRKANSQVLDSINNLTLLEIENALEQSSKNTHWAPVFILDKGISRLSVGSKLLQRKGRSPYRACEEGSVLRSPERFFTDGRIFRSSSRRKSGWFGGSILLDVSGSMSINYDEIFELLKHAPYRTTIACYSGEMRGHISLRLCNQHSIPHGPLRSHIANRLNLMRNKRTKRYPKGALGVLAVLAAQGKMVTKDYLSENNQVLQFGRNAIDGPALQWLTTQPGPYFWVSDGLVNGAQGYGNHLLAAHCFKLMQAHKITRIPDVPSMLEFIKTGNKDLIDNTIPYIHGKHMPT